MTGSESTETVSQANQVDKSMGPSIETILDRADIANDFDTQGDSVAIADALADLFGGEVIAISDELGSKKLEHAAARINNKIYVGDGETTERELVKEVAGEGILEARRYTWYPSSVETQNRRSKAFREIKNRLKAAKADHTEDSYV